MPPVATRTSNFLTNVLWSWSGVAVNLFAGFFLSPFLIRRLGTDNFGIWTLVLVMVENYWLLDFGFRNATVKYTAHYRALGQPVEVSRVISTAILYSSVVAAITLILTLFFRAQIGHLLHSETPAFNTLLLIVGVSWSVGIVFNVFGSALDAVQRFDITSRLWIISTAVRVILTLAVVLSGYGLREMALVLFASQVFIYTASFYYFYKLFPEVKLSLKQVNLKTLKEMAAFASHNFAISISLRILSQSPLLLIGMSLPNRFVAYFSVPQKLLDYPADAIGRVGNVSGTTAAGMYARGEWSEITRLAISTNRYCAALYFFLVAYLSIYAKPFIALWLTPEFADNSAVLIPILLVGAAAVTSQYNSAAILVHVGGQKWYARILMIEAALFVLIVPATLIQYGLVGAATVMSTLAVLSRGFGLSWLLTRKLHVSYLSFLYRIYVAPVAILALVMILLAGLRMTWLPGTNVIQLGLSALIGGSVYGSLAIAFVLSPAHRTAGWDRLRLLTSGFNRHSERPA
jgi:O-antigen/teichoic acid export membrane protein